MTGCQAKKKKTLLAFIHCLVPHLQHSPTIPSSPSHQILSLITMWPCRQRQIISILMVHKSHGSSHFRTKEAFLRGGKMSSRTSTKLLVEIKLWKTKTWMDENLYRQLKITCLIITWWFHVITWNYHLLRLCHNYTAEHKHTQHKNTFLKCEKETYKRNLFEELSPFLCVCVGAIMLFL